MNQDWPLWEVFIRSRNGLAHKHVGSVHAADAAHGDRARARRLHAPRGGRRIWVVPSAAIIASDPAEADRCSSRRATRSTATRPSTRFPDEVEEPVSAPADTTACGAALAAAHVRYVLRLADTSLVLGQRLGEWIGHAPQLEEDLGLANLALDLIGQARLLLTYAGELEGQGRDEDALAFLRDAPQFMNLALVEQPNGDFGHTIVRQWLTDTWQLELYEALMHSSDARLAAIAAKAVKETRYH